MNDRAVRRFYWPQVSSLFRGRHRRLALSLLFFLLLGSALAAIIGCRKDESSAHPPEAFLPATYQPARLAAASPARCAACHAEAVTDWRKSQHAVANRPVKPAIDRPHFTRPVSDGDADTAHPTIIDDILAIADGPPIDSLGTAYPVAGVIAVDPLIQYLIPAEGGRWQAHSLAFDPRAQEWFDLFPGENREPGEWGHWTGQGMNWNANCAACHMTEFEKHYEVTADQYDSTWTAHGISCLQCHSNSIEHADAAEAGSYLVATSEEPSPQLQMENCASCHSLREELTPNAFRASDRFDDHYRLTLPDVPDLYFADGQARGENFVYGSFMLSRMGHAGVTCMDCHNPHSGETTLPAANNALCMQCHATGRLNAPIIIPTEHSHHPAGSTGNRCIECHMPERTYMVRDPRRDHGFTSPDPALTLELGVPNACSTCHADESVEWAAEHAAQWYSSERQEELRSRARLLARAYTGDPVHDELIQAASDASNPYWESTFLHLLSAAPSSTESRRLAQEALADENATVRAAGVHLLAHQTSETPDLAPAFEDPVRVVRIEAAEALQLDVALPDPLASEWRAYLDANADRPGTRFRMAEIALAQGEPFAAERHLRHAIDSDRLNGEVYFEAAILLARAEVADRAFAFLRMAPPAARESGLLAYADGLLSAERGNYARAIERLQEAVGKDPAQPRWWYNLALAYAEGRNIPEARAAIDQGLRHTPDDSDLLALKRYFSGR